MIGETLGFGFITKYYAQNLKEIYPGSVFFTISKICYFIIQKSRAYLRAHFIYNSYLEWVKKPVRFFMKITCI